MTFTNSYGDTCRELEPVNGYHVIECKGKCETYFEVYDDEDFVDSFATLEDAQEFCRQ